ncbi:hypothetical protein DS2_04745 [Catenovulum agarivorans DS-2]|uniref:PcRGLX/YetA-like N-terminal RIFT barrel domain-containing protein n=1 Tax=Catenovulum agarivorans DS-2 TaxID=1328313 RepID=W7QGY1_9ALTE|nr:hypothetical protein [Catenovulum agarivorans]EWH11136.1 hypothetical protein DS2_04745 [Catenovulum agarivorans DS-2]
MSPSFNIAISIEENLGVSRIAQPCQFSIPFIQGQTPNAEYVDLVSQTGRSIRCSKRILGYWPDGSIKWLQIAFLANVDANQKQQLNVVICEPKKERQQQKITTVDKADVAVGIKLQVSKQPLFESSAQWQLIESTELTSTQQAKFQWPGDENIQIELLRTSYLETGDSLYAVKLLNARAATHSGGLWDLGDSASLDIEFCHVEFAQLPSQLSLTENSIEQTPHNLLRLVQVASGGENWSSPVHLDKNLQIPYKLNGAQLIYANGDIQNLANARVNPQVACAEQFTIKPQQFWQHFPKGLAVEQNKVIVELLPKCEYLHELQAGEQTSLFISCYNQQNTTDFASQGLAVKVDFEHIQNCQVWPNLARPDKPSAIEKIIQLSVAGESNFFAKREVVDEYGWRNFGDLYADHETDGYTGDDIFVSHYNNQYDPIYGFLRQWTLTQDSRYLELAQDLAKHVKDIDIYHTELDKAEYNHGLFWHTDHYLPAKTATHRTYSKHHEQGAYMDHAGGGGPGGQHCYTTGLMYHYFLTGDESSKQAVLNLTQWIGHIYDGEGGLLEALLAVKNAGQAGYTNLVTGQYPLDRGVGNFVNALLDSYQLTNDSSYLTKAFDVLQNTIHPNEDLSIRELSNVEYSWFYTVLLQAACRYLQIKEQAQELDTSFYYVRDALLHYVLWMEQNEYPYLEKPEILEYPNQTWTAQDMRKANIFALAAYYAPESDMANKFWHKALYFYQYVADTLSQDDNQEYTRILVLLMQNHGVIEYFSLHKPEQKFAAVRSYKQPNWHKTSTKIVRLLKLSVTRLVKISVKRELNWLAKRSAKVAKLLGKSSKEAC